MVLSLPLKHKNFAKIFETYIIMVTNLRPNFFHTFRIILFSLLGFFALHLYLSADELNFIENSIDTSKDQTNLMPSNQKGTASWNAATKTLTLKDAVIETSADAINAYIPDMVLRLEGKNTITTNSPSTAAIRMRSSMRIEGTGSLYIVCNSETGTAIAMEGTAAPSLYIKDATLSVKGTCNGIIGSYMGGTLTIDGASVTATTGNPASKNNISIGGFSNIDIKGGAKVRKPEGAKPQQFESIMCCISLDGKDPCAGEVIIAPDTQKTFKVEIAPSEHGSISVVGNPDLNNLMAGTTLQFKATPDEGYKLKSLMAGDQDITAALAYLVQASVTIKATFEKKPTYKVTIEPSEYGTLSVKETNVNLEAVKEGTKLHVVAKPKKGYELNKIFANDYDITMIKEFVVNGDVVLKATYDALPVTYYAIHIEIEGDGRLKVKGDDGKYIQNLKKGVPAGTILHFEALPDRKEIALKSLKVDEKNITKTLSYTMPAKDIEVVATFYNQVGTDIIEKEDFTFEVVGEKIFLTNIDKGTEVALYSVNGVKYYSVRPAKNLSDIVIDATLFPKGCYLLKVGNRTKKIVL